MGHYLYSQEQRTKDRTLTFATLSDGKAIVTISQVVAFSESGSGSRNTSKARNLVRKSPPGLAALAYVGKHSIQMINEFVSPESKRTNASPTSSNVLGKCLVKLQP